MPIHDVTFHMSVNEFCGKSDFWSDYLLHEVIMAQETIVGWVWGNARVVAPRHSQEWQLLKLDRMRQYSDRL
jgi:hypothetical protein